ncbi:hypothetical protein FGE12_16570 [Aggregicoccus sp. 17bor-14]|uniref:hypothetical protein n=1 Tax=Myxococcaceae TaxID=31 RepID=UPI00129CC55C|nr:MULTISPECIES: hypothetical protein [Myxococcaceae]MBF5044014.1 hypothetical protein [Simulacricoccus sp. 17bor-14]MRI89765.1 hypothetical protein [Aggregicoccus sp. 17bor-14]
MTLRTVRLAPLAFLCLSLGCGESTPSGAAGIALSFVDPSPLQLGGKHTYTVHAERKGSIEGPLHVTVDEPSLGFSFAPFDIPGDATDASVTIAISDGPMPGLLDVPFHVVTSGGGTWNVTLPLQVVDVPAGVEPQLHFERTSAFAGGDVDVTVSVDRTNGFTKGLQVYVPLDGPFTQGFGSANFGYATETAPLHLKLKDNVSPGTVNIPYVLTFGGAYGSEVHERQGTFPLEVLAPSPQP